MKIKEFMSQGISSNTYLIEDEKRCLVDAGIDPIDLQDLDVLLLTHCHFDHIARAKEIVGNTGCELWMSRKEADFFESERAVSSAAKYFDFDTPLDFDIDKKLEDGEIIDLGQGKLNVVITPGHTPGGCCLYVEDERILFSGDTVFANGFGRYDLMGGDREKLQESLRRLAGLDAKTLYPGHGPKREGDVPGYISSLKV